MSCVAETRKKFNDQCVDLQSVPQGQRGRRRAEDGAQGGAGPSRRPLQPRLE